MMRLWSLLLFFVLSSAAVSFAELRKSDLELQAPATQAAALLNQVDILSLYFSSSQIAHAPQFLEDKMIVIESTLLDDSLVADRVRLEAFLLRQIQVFLRELKVRLTLYAPTVSKRFNENTDIRFVINQGPEREPLGVWREGKLFFGSEEVASVTVTKSEKAVFQLNETRVARGQEKLELWRACPAFRGK